MGVDLPVTDVAATDSDDTAQSPRQPFTVPPIDQVDPNIGDAETDPGNTPSAPTTRHAALDGVGADRDVSSSKNRLVSGVKWGLEIAVGIPVAGAKRVDKASQPGHTPDEIIDMAAQDYDLEHLKNSIPLDEFDQRIDKWKEFRRQHRQTRVPCLDLRSDLLRSGIAGVLCFANMVLLLFAQRGKGKFPSRVQDVIW